MSPTLLAYMTKIKRDVCAPLGYERATFMCWLSYVRDMAWARRHFDADEAVL